ncbi:MAG: hypothetical protein ACI32C_05850 [Candidatus Enteromonas sp.]
MKKEIAYSIIPLLGLTSCWFKVNHRRNIIVPGHFSGVNEYDESVLCDLWIEPISKEEYKHANGINVIRDEINRKHYSVHLSIISPGIVTQPIVFS